MSSIDEILGGYGFQAKSDSEKAKTLSVTEPPEPDDGLTRRFKQEDAVLNAFALAAKTNPEQYAKLKKRAVEAGMDPEQVDQFPAEAERRRRYTEAVRLVQEAPTTAKWVADPENAKIGTDNVDNLSQIETAIRSLKRGFTASLRGFDTTQIEEATHVLGIIDRIEKGEFKSYGELAKATPYAGLFADYRKDTLAKWKQRFQAQLAENVPEFRRRAKELESLQPSPALQKFYEAQGVGASLDALFDAPGEVALNIALESAGLMGPALPAIVAGGAAAGPGMMSGIVGMSSYQAEYANSIADAIEKKGISLDDTEALKQYIASPEFLEIKRKATIKAGTIAVFDAATARMAGVKLGKTEAGNLAKQTGIQMAGGGAGEVAGSVLSGQDVNASSVIAEMIGEIPGSVVDVGTMAAREVYLGQARVAEAEQRGKIMEALNKLAQADKVLSRDADSFEAFVAEAAQEGPVDTVFVSGKMLMQSGLAPQMAEASPSVRDQLDRAIISNTDIAIPLPEYMARIAPTEMAGQLIDYIKFDPNEPTRAEVNEYIKEYGETLKADVEAQIAQREDADAFRVSRETVKQDILGQLNEVGRFRPDVNEVYAELMARYFSVRAAAMGMTPEELFAKRMMRVKGESVGGQQYDQVLQAPDRQLKISDLPRDMPIEFPKSNIPQPDVYNQRRKEPRNDYTLDLFGVPAQQGTDTAAEGHPARSDTATLSRDDVEGRFATRTEIVQENARELGTDKVTTVDEAAQALAYLGRGAVERFDALITDKDGKPLAVVGAFKGALSQTSVFPSTVAGEAFRINGAAHIWFAHNHPSGVAELSAADRNLNRALGEVFRGSEITAHGLFAIGGNKDGGRDWVFGSIGQAGDQYGTTTKPTTKHVVPVVERVFTAEEKLGPAIISPGTARAASESIAAGESGIILLDAKNAPVAFVPVDPNKVDVLRTDGRMDALYRAISMANSGAAIIVNNGNLSEKAILNLGAFLSQIETRPLDVMDTAKAGVESWVEKGKSLAAPVFYQTDTGPRGGFDPETNIITLLKGADLSTFLHEGAHFFFENDIGIAAQLMDEARKFGTETLKPGEQQILDDVSTLLKWHGIEGPIEEQLRTWYSMDFEERRYHHERTAESFEAYLFSGKAPSLELQAVFQRLRSWMLNVYRSLKAFLERNPEAGKLTAEVREVFDRMVASQEEITLAEQARSMLPLFANPEQSGMTPAEFAAYQAQGANATNEAMQEMDAKGLRDMQWLANAKGKQIKKLQRTAKSLRSAVEMEARREVMSRPVYRAWEFLTRKLDKEDKLPPLARKSDPGVLDPTMDSLFVAIAKLGGIRKDQALSEWGIDPKNKPQSGVFGKPVWRIDGGLPLNLMAEALAREGYLQADEHGKLDLAEFYDRFVSELSGDTQYSNAWQPDNLLPGEQVINHEALGAGRLDIGALAELLQAEEAVVDRLQALKMTDDNGIHPDIVAGLIVDETGASAFENGDDMARQLAEATPPRQAIAELTDRMMLERHGELATPEAIERSAEAAIYNDARARFVTTEYNALAKALGEKEQTGTDSKGRPIMRQILPRVAKEYAAQIIARLTVANVRPSLYASAAERAAKAAQKALNAWKLAEAAAEKRNQVINIYATRAAYDAQDEVKAVVRHMHDLQKPSVQRNMRGEFLVQLNALLARFNFRQMAAQEKIPLADWIDQEADRLAAALPDLPGWILDETFVKPYKDMTIEELRGLNDAVRQLEHMARREQKMYKAVRNQNYQQEIASILADLAQTNPEAFDGDSPIEYRKDTLPLVKELAGRFKSKFDAEFLNIENLLDVMTHGKGKQIFESLFSRLSTAQDERTLFMRKLGAYMNQYTKAYSMKERMGMAFNKRRVPGTKLYLTHEQRLAVALFNGNAEGRQRLADGNRYTQAEIQAIINNLDAKDVEMVKAIWRMSDEMIWPELKALNERTVGIAPEKVQATPFQHPTLGELPGGYVPLVYDGDMDSRALDLNTNASVQELLGGTATVAATGRSASKARLDVVKRPLDLSLRAMAYKINETVHDITHREAIADTYRLLQSKRISNAIRTIAGPDVYRSLIMHVREMAVKPRTPSGFSEKTFWFLRKNTLVNMMGASFNTIAINVLGTSPLMRRVGPVNFIRHMGTFTPAKYRDVLEKSLYMRERLRSFDRDMHEELSRLGGANVMPSIGFWFSGLSAMDRFVTMPGWTAAYELGLKQNNNDEAAAVDFADRVIRQTQGSGRVVDLAKIAGGVGTAGEFKRIITMFYNFFNAQLGQIRRGMAISGKQWTDGQQIRAAGNLVLDVMAVIIIPATLEAIARQNCGDDPEAEDYLYCAARSSTMFTASFFPIFRDVLPYVWRQFDPDFVGGFGVRLSPVESALETMARTPKAVADVATGEQTETDYKTLVHGAGYAIGLPGFQAWRIIDGYKALSEGETDNPGVLLTGPERKQ